MTSTSLLLSFDIHLLFLVLSTTLAVFYDDGERDYLHFNNNNNKNYINKTKSKLLPHAIVIGVKKGGTRALLEFLKFHPQVEAPGPEVHFFDKRYQNGLRWYRQQMPATSYDQLTIEKTPSYFVVKPVPKRIYKMSKAIKLILVVRDPVIRLISDYTQQLSKRKNLQSFTKFAFVDYGNDDDDYNGTSSSSNGRQQQQQQRFVNSSWAAIRIGLYANHLERWLKYFSIRQMHFVNGENLISNPSNELQMVERFLNLRPFIRKEHFYFNATKGFPCLKKSACLGKTKGRSHPQIKADIIERLREFFRPFNKRFYQMTQIDFGWP